MCQFHVRQEWEDEAHSQLEPRTSWHKVGGERSKSKSMRSNTSERPPLISCRTGISRMHQCLKDPSYAQPAAQISDFTWPDCAECMTGTCRPATCMVTCTNASHSRCAAAARLPLLPSLTPLLTWYAPHEDALRPRLQRDGHRLLRLDGRSPAGLHHKAR